MQRRVRSNRAGPRRRSGNVPAQANVLQWRQDWYRPYRERDKPFTPATDAETGRGDSPRATTTPGS